MYVSTVQALCSLGRKGPFIFRASAIAGHERVLFHERASTKYSHNLLLPQNMLLHAPSQCHEAANCLQLMQI